MLVSPARLRRAGKRAISPMTATIRPAPLAPRPTAPPPEALQSILERRFVCRVLQLFRFCPFARCRRMRACQGEPQRCLATHGAAVPHEARVAAEAILISARYNCVREGSGDQWLKESYRGELAAFGSFIRALESPDLRKKGYALKARFRRWRQRKANSA
jgi:hypothetical protein